jgi:hypothetical protein
MMWQRVMWQTEAHMSKMMFSYPLRGTKYKYEIAKRDQNQK